MQTTSETILLITIWILTGTGLFFGIRSKIRKISNARKLSRANVKGTE